MKTTKGTGLLRWAALGSMALGVFLFATNWKHFHTDQRQLLRKTQDLETLYAVENSLTDERAGLLTYEGLVQPKAKPLDEIVASTLPSIQPTVRSREPRLLEKGWSARQMELSFATMTLHELGRFLEKAEAERPPWRLSECTISASETAAGMGRATLVMEVLEQSTSAVRN